MRTDTVTTVLQPPQQEVFDVHRRDREPTANGRPSSLANSREGDDYKVVNGLGEFYFTI